jgi:DivIVA domain-containing protein
MMFWFQLAVVVLLLIAVGWIAVGGGGHMSAPVPDRPDPAVPDTGLLGRGDVDKVRFSVGARGYRMDEVDDVLDRLAHEIDLRERRIAQLEGRPYVEPATGDPVLPSAEQPPAMPQQTAQAEQGQEQETREAPESAAPAGPEETAEQPGSEQPGSAEPDGEATDDPGHSEA